MMPLLPKIGFRENADLLFIFDDQNRCHDVRAFRWAAWFAPPPCSPRPLRSSRSASSVQRRASDCSDCLTSGTSAARIASRQRAAFTRYSAGLVMERLHFWSSMIFPPCSVLLPTLGQQCGARLCSTRTRKTRAENGYSGVKLPFRPFYLGRSVSM